MAGYKVVNGVGLTGLEVDSECWTGQEGRSRRHRIGRAELAPDAMMWKARNVRCQGGPGLTVTLQATTTVKTT
jgi:hypothetical protein